MSKVFDENLPNLLSLGFAFHGKPPRQSADPESVTLSLLPAFFEDRKLFRMLLTWLYLVTDLIHIERIGNLAKTLPPNLRIVLAVISLKLSKRDRRWKKIYAQLRALSFDVKESFATPVEYKDAYLISKYGVDPEFQSLGIEISTILPADEKKILSLNAILKLNGWLRLRALMGANFRADVAFLYLSKKVSGPAEAMRELRCARDTAYRNWRALEAAEARKVIRVSA